MKIFNDNAFARLLFFGNYFYGICAVALSVEATLQQKLPLPGKLFFFLAFCSTVLFYSKAYIVTDLEGDKLNERTQWYVVNRKRIEYTQWFFILSVAAGAFYLTLKYTTTIFGMWTEEWILISVFPVVSVIYYGLPFNGKHINLRNIGWLKPFIIAFSWAGLVTVYPAMYYCLEHGLKYEPNFVALLLFIKNFMFIALLCILFDVKDYAMDYNKQIKTFVVKLGLRKTLYYLIVPLCLVGLGSFLIYATLKDFSALKVLINTIPFFAVLAVAYSMYSRRSIFYYLVVIDGLMLLKALCGITAMTWF